MPDSLSQDSTLKQPSPKLKELMQNNTLPVGLKVKYRDDIGEIAFSCEDCVTIRIHNPNSSERRREVRIVVPNIRFDEIELLTGNHSHDF